MKEKKRLWIFLGLTVLGLSGMTAMRTEPQSLLYAMMDDHRMGHEGLDGMNRNSEGVNPDDLPDSESPGAKLVENYCTQCHSLPDPMRHSDSEWPGVVDRMESRIQGSGRRLFNEREKGEIIRYLSNHSEHK